MSQPKRSKMDLFNTMPVCGAFHEAQVLPSRADSRGCEIAISDILCVAFLPQLNRPKLILARVAWRSPLGTFRLAVAVSPECMRAVSKNTICSQARLQSTVVCDAMQNRKSDSMDFLLNRRTDFHYQGAGRCSEALPTAQHECGGVNLSVHTVRLVNDARQPPKAASSPDKPDSLAVCFLWALVGRTLPEDFV